MASLSDGIDIMLKDWATDRQIQFIDHLNISKSAPATAKHFGVSLATVHSSIDGLKKRAASKGYSPVQESDFPLTKQVTTSQIKHFVIPDVQSKHDIDFSYLTSTGKYIVAKKPDVIICIGDFADMESLSTYDVGLKSFEGRAYKKDIWAARDAMDALLTPLYHYNKQAILNGTPEYKPRMVLTLGNHENRIDRAINADRKLEGLISVDDLPYQDWEVIPFLEVIVIDGIAYSHYFTSGVMGRPVTTAQAILTKKHMSCFAGHQQGRQIAYGRRADGKEMTAIIAGSYYEHEEAYLGAQGNLHWRGLYVLHNVHDGAFDEMAVPLSYIKENY